MARYLFYGNHRYIYPILRPLQARLSARGDETAWFVADDIANYLQPSEHRLVSVREVKTFDPCAVFVPGNVVPDYFPGIKVELFHGFHVRKRSDERGHFRIRGFFDLYCTQGPDTSEQFTKLAQEHGYFETVETGWPKMDPYFASTATVTSRAKPVVLLTSTFTPRLSCARPLLETVKALAVTGRWEWLVQFHPKMDTEVVAAYHAIESDNLHYIESEDVVPLLQTADVMVSDTSSIVSEFLLLDKPVVTLNNRAPGDHLIDIDRPEKLADAIEQALQRPAPLMTAIRAYSDHIHPYRDGRSSERVLAATDALVARGTSHLKSKPFNLMRRLQMRRKLGYFGL